jgi:hypothetical protein
MEVILGALAGALILLGLFAVVVTFGCALVAVCWVAKKALD